MFKLYQENHAIQGNKLLSAALLYAELGYKVFQCAPNGKHPLGGHGFKDATTDHDQIERWWAANPTANIGMHAEGLLVIDVDGSENSWPNDEAKASDLMVAPMALTPSGGRHYVFSADGKAYKNSASKIAHKVDVRGDDGYIVVWPSMFEGNQYQWPIGCELQVPPDQLPTPPAWLVESLADKPASDTPVAATGDGNSIIEGGRNHALTGLGGTMRRYGLAADELGAALQQINQNRCKPPLPPGEVEDIANSVCRYEPDILATDMAEHPEGSRPPRPKLEPFVPFPVEVLPEPIQAFVIQGAKAIGCDATFLALPMLSALASAIGNTRRIQLKRGWSEPSILWLIIVAESGAKKSPAVELALRAVRKRQHEAMKIFRVEFDKYKMELREYDKAYTIWKRQKDNIDQPVPPVIPIADRCWIDDATVEALAVLLQDQPRGLLMVRDELSSWLGGMDRYAGGKGSDVSKWLEMYGGRSMLVDRKMSKQHVYVERAAVSIAGGIQPSVLKRSLGREYHENGLAARLLMAYPPTTANQWCEDEISRAVELSIETLFDRLYDLKPDANEDGDWIPRTVRLSDDGKKTWVEFYNEHAEQMANLTGDLAAVWSKLEGYAARFALVVHEIRVATDDHSLVNPDEVDAVSVKAAIALTRWFGGEAKRIYEVFGESDENGEHRRLVELIRRKGGAVTSRELCQSSRAYANTEAAKLALDELADAGHGKFEYIKPQGDDGGRPKNVFKLSTSVYVYETPSNDSASGGYVDVDAVDAPKTTNPDDEWGEI